MLFISYSVNLIETNWKNKQMKKINRNLILFRILCWSILWCNSSEKHVKWTLLYNFQAHSTLLLTQKFNRWPLNDIHDDSQMTKNLTNCPNRMTLHFSILCKYLFQTKRIFANRFSRRQDRQRTAINLTKSWRFFILIF